MGVMTNRMGMTDGRRGGRSGSDRPHLTDDRTRSSSGLSSKTPSEEEQRPDTRGQFIKSHRQKYTELICLVLKLYFYLRAKQRKSMNDKMSVGGGMQTFCEYSDYRIA